MPSNSSSSGRNGGIGFTGMLTILFVGLKLAGYIDWSWWWVLSPLWIPLSLATVLLATLFFVNLLKDDGEK